MTDAVMKFTKDDRLGRVAAVDTSRVLITVEAHQHMASVAVGNLVAIRGRTATEFLVGMIERATRSVTEGLIADSIDENGDIPLGETQEDYLKVVLLGTYRAVDGDHANTFKRGADSFPQVDRDCFWITGPNLQSFMNLLSENVAEGERMHLGHYVADQTAVAIAHGDRFFQRHAAVLGSTGSG
ncbi:MAG: ATPase, partial [Gammaproteobacteria bacterium]